MKRYLELARRQANQSVFSKQKHGCILIKGGSIINASHNSPCFNSFAERFFKGADRKHASQHAEIRTVLNLDKSLTNGSTAIVVRVNNKNEFCMSRPCEMCVDLLTFTGVKKVIYSVDNDHIEVLKL